MVSTTPILLPSCNTPCHRTPQAAALLPSNRLIDDCVDLLFPDFNRRIQYRAFQLVVVDRLYDAFCVGRATLPFICQSRPHRARYIDAFVSLFVENMLGSLNLLAIADAAVFSRPVSLGWSTHKGRRHLRVGRLRSLDTPS